MTNRAGRVDFNDSGVVQLYRDVCDYIAKHWPSDAPMLAFGIRERWKQINDGTGGANRIVMIPGALTGEDGSADQPVGPGDSEGGGFGSGAAHPRTLFLQAKIITFSLWAANNTTPDAVSDEALQQEAIEQMQEWLYRAVKASSVGAANATWKAHRYNRAPSELKYGTEYLITLELETPYLDRDNVKVIPSAAAVSRADS